MTTRPARLAVGIAIALVASLLLAPEAPADLMPTTVVKEHRCGRLDRPEPGLQGDVPKAEQDANRAYGGYNCGLALVGHARLDADHRSPTGNANMAWAGDCAYVAGAGAVFGPARPTAGAGVAVVDVSDPRRPRHVRTLRTPGALSTLETLHAVTTKGRSVLVVGQYGNDHWPTEPKPMDVYDVSDCARPKLLQTVYFPENIHNLTISGNGRYVFATQPIQVVDLDPLFDRDPASKAVYLGSLDDEIPGPLVSPATFADHDDEVPWSTNAQYVSHEAWPTRDGTKLYLGGQLPTWEIFTIVDIADWLRRTPAGQPAGPPRIISQRSGRGHSVRTATIDGKPFVLHSEESVIAPGYGCFGEELNPLAGPAEPWLTDISDETDPRRVSQFGLEINQVENCGAQMRSNVTAATHYHDVDDERRTTFAMVSMWNAGIRVFDVRDPAAPAEVAYFNPADVDAGPGTRLDKAWGHVRYVGKTGHIWFATEDGGFWVVELEPQVRRYLGLDRDGAPPPARFPSGRPGTKGLAVSVPASLDVDVSAYYCTLGSASAITP